MNKWSDIVGNVGKDQYDKKIAFLKESGLYTKSIEETVGATIRNLKAGDGRAFVVFSEPQSGKTEKMIALNK